jgi:hypothetical protein
VGRVLIYDPLTAYQKFDTVETVYPRKREVPKGFLEAVVGDTRRQVESRRVEEVVSSGSVEHDLRLALEVSNDLSSTRIHDSSFRRTAKNLANQCRYLSTTAPLTSCFFQIGKTRSYMSPRTFLLLHTSFPLKTTSPLPLTKFLNPVHGPKV